MAKVKSVEEKLVEYAATSPGVKPAELTKSFNKKFKATLTVQKVVSILKKAAPASGKTESNGTAVSVAPEKVKKEQKKAKAPSGEYKYREKNGKPAGKISGKELPGKTIKVLDRLFLLEDLAELLSKHCREVVQDSGPIVESSLTGAELAAAIG